MGAEPWDPRRHRSYSQLSSYSSCGMRYKLERIDKVPSPPSTFLIKGSAVHSSLQDWEESGRTVDVAANFSDHFAATLLQWETKYPDVESWGKTWNVGSVAKDLELRKADGLKEVNAYTEMAVAQADDWMPLRLPDGTLAIELPFKIDFGSEVPFFLRGYIDALLCWSDGRVTVRDFKSGGDDREEYRQLGLYAYAARTQYGIPVEWGEYWYTKLPAPGGGVGRSSGWRDLSRYDRDHLYRQYSQMDKGIEEQIFIANPSKSNCRMCSVRQHCPEMSGY